MVKAISFMIDGLPPAKKNQWHIRRGGKGMFKSMATRVFDLAVLRSISSRRWPEWINGRMSVEIFLHQNDRRRRDIDNMATTVLDALNHSITGFDDSRVDELCIYRSFTLSPFTVVRIKPYEAKDVRD